MMTWFIFFILIKEQLRSDKKEIEPHHASNEKAYSHSILRQKKSARRIKKMPSIVNLG